VALGISIMIISVTFPIIIATKEVIILSTGRSHFQVISHWIKRTAFMMNTEIIGEIYASQGVLLTSKNEKVQPIISNYLQVLEKAGKEIATDKLMSVTTEKALEKSFVPDEIYIQGLNHQIDIIRKSY
jgi:hypothetical protein